MGLKIGPKWALAVLKRKRPNGPWEWALRMGLEPKKITKTKIKYDKNIKIKYDKYGIKHNTKNKI